MWNRQEMGGVRFLLCCRLFKSNKANDNACCEENERLDEPDHAPNCTIRQHPCLLAPRKRRIVGTVQTLRWTASTDVSERRCIGSIAFMGDGIIYLWSFSMIEEEIGDIDTGL